MIKNSLAGLCLFLSLLFVGCNSSASDKEAEASGKVVGVSDGDSFTLLTPENKQVKVRLYGIDAPEKAQSFGQVSRQKLSDLIFGKPVRLDEKDTDRYGRVVAEVYDMQNLNVNEEMIRTGMAWHYTQYSNNLQWDEVQEEARQARRGLWADAEPTPPWNWRKAKREASGSGQKSKPKKTKPKPEAVEIDEF